MLPASLKDSFRLLRASSPQRIWNYILLHISGVLSQVTGSAIRWGMPAFITIEPTTNCNLACPECNTGANMITRPKGHIEMPIFRKIIDESWKTAIYLTLYFQGEPYLHPDFFEMIAEAKNKGLYVASSTNAHFLNEINAEKTVTSGLDRLIISFDGPDTETYNSYRYKGVWEKVISGIKNIVAAKKKLRSSSPYLILQCLLLKGNESRKNEVSKLAQELGADQLEFKTLQLLDPSKPNELLPINKKYSRYIIKSDGSAVIKQKAGKFCKRAHYSCVITWDGQVLPCCYDKNAQYCFGNIKGQSLKEIWNSQNTRQFLLYGLKNRNEIPICNNCMR
jgi:radical SAM protein with 4Fe4S-binding SPASM domain